MPGPDPPGPLGGAKVSGGRFVTSVLLVDRSSPEVCLAADDSVVAVFEEGCATAPVEPPAAELLEPALLPNDLPFPIRGFKSRPSRSLLGEGEGFELAGSEVPSVDPALSALLCDILLSK